MFKKRFGLTLFIITVKAEKMILTMEGGEGKKDEEGEERGGKATRKINHNNNS